MGETVEKIAGKKGVSICWCRTTLGQSGLLTEICRQFHKQKYRIRIDGRPIPRKEGLRNSKR